MKEKLKTSDDPAFPVPPDFISNAGELCQVRQFGLTKREYFAAMAMQGIAANERYINTCIAYAAETGTTPEQQVAIRATMLADALLSILSTP